MRRKESNTLQILWMSISSFCTFFLAIISSAFLSRYLAVFEYGTYKQIMYIYTTLLGIFTVGLPAAFSYFLPTVSLSEAKDISGRLTKMFFILGFIFSLFLYAGSPYIAAFMKNPSLSEGLKIFAITPLLLLPTIGVESIYIIAKKTQVIAIYHIVTKLLSILCIVLPVYLLKGNLHIALYGWVTASAFSLCIAIGLKYYIYKDVAMSQSDISFKTILSYCIPLMVASLYGLIINNADQIVISRVLGTETFAYYANGFIELPFIAMIVGPITAVFQPLFVKLYAEKKYDEIIMFWNNMICKTIVIIYPILLFVFFFSNELMTLLYGVRYIASSGYFQIMQFVSLFSTLNFGLLLLSFGASKKYSNIHLLLAILIFPVEYLFAYLFGNGEAVAMASALLKVLKCLLFLYFSMRLLDTQLYKLIPLAYIMKIFLFLIPAIIIIRTLSRYLLSSDIVILLFSSVIFFIYLLILSSIKFINIGFFSSFKLVLKR